MKFTIPRPPGFSLVEVTLAMGIAAFCLLAIMALFPTSLATNQITIQQTANTNLAAAIAADLRATPITSSTSPRYGITIPSTGNTTHTIFLQDDGTAGAQDTDAVSAQTPKYRATIMFSASSNSSQKTATGVRILLTWPALADPVASSTPTKYTGAYEVYTALNRN
jgi:uncharacterized protein (TIGR02598 family)